MKRLVPYGLSVLVALVLGLGSAWWTINGSLASVPLGPWQYDPLVGSDGADPYLRARVARVALLALNKSEALYLFAVADDDGNPLRSDGVYRIEGRDFDCRWWSITVYDAANFLIPNEEKRYSYNSADVKRDAKGGYTIVLARAKRSGNWIPTGEGETFRLALRIYNPAAGVRDRFATMLMPRIIREK